MKRTRRTKIFAAAVILSAFIVFFTGKVYDPATQTRSFELVTNGVDYFRQGLDISGGSRLVYQIDYNKYKEIYTDYLELQQVQENVEQIILQNIDKRISSLGVSDYRSFLQMMDDERYIVVELGGVSDIEEAKKIIGRTVELEFRLPNEEEASPETLAARKSLAENLFGQVQEGTSIDEIATNRNADGIYANKYNGVSASELPSIYQDNIELLNNMATGSVHNELWEGVYHDSSSDPDASIEGFTFFTLVDRKIVDNAALTTQIAIQAAAANGLDYKQDFVLKDPGVGFDDYSYSDGKIVYNIAKAFSGSYAYDSKIVAIEKQPTIGQTQEQIEQEDARIQAILATVREQIRSDAIVGNEDAIVVYDGWIDSDSVRGTIPSFTDGDEAIREFDDTNFSFVVYNRAVKQPSDTLYEVLEIDGVNAGAFASWEAGLQSTTRYVIHDVLVQNTEAWVPAMDTKTNRVLNGTYFSMASVGSSQLGKPVVQIQFDNQGKDIFCSITDANIGNQMAIFVGGELITSPVIQDRICGGTAQIDGDFTGAGAKELSDSLNDGTLPAPLMIKQEEKIDATLGANALQASLLAMFIGLIAILFFIYYMFGGRKAIAAAVTLTTFLILLAAFIKLVDYALSLSAIAAVILSLGMAVDANIIIYERIREELRAGKTIGSAIDTGHDKSWSAIRDGNVSTGIIALLLFTLGLNMFKGFGSMMIINILIVVFVCVPMIKEVLHILFHRKDAFLSEEGRWLEVEKKEGDTQNG